MTVTGVGTMTGMGVKGILTQTVDPPSAEGAAQLFRNILKIKTTGNRTMSPIITLRAKPELAPGTGTTSTGWHPIGLDSLPFVLAISEGTAKGNMTAVRSGLQLSSGAGGWTIENYRGLLFQDSIGGGTVTRAIAVDVENLTTATTNYSLRSVGEAVLMKHEGPVELGKSIGLWKVSPPATQHEAIAVPTNEATLIAAVTALIAVDKEYGQTK
jgi:hypothetical protein